MIRRTHSRVSSHSTSQILLKGRVKRRKKKEKKKKNRRCWIVTWIKRIWTAPAHTYVLAGITSTQFTALCERAGVLAAALETDGTAVFYIPLLTRAQPNEANPSSRCGVGPTRSTPMPFARESTMLGRLPVLEVSKHCGFFLREVWRTLVGRPVATHLLQRTLPCCGCCCR